MKVIQLLQHFRFERISALGATATSECVHMKLHIPPATGPRSVWAPSSESHMNDTSAAGIHPAAFTGNVPNFDHDTNLGDCMRGRVKIRVVANASIGKKPG